MNDVILAPSASPYAPESPRTFDDLAGTLASNQAVFITEPWFVFIAPKNVDLTSMFEKPPRHIKHSLRDDERFAYWFQLENPFKPWREHRFTMFHSANQFRDSIEINFDRTGFDWPIESVKIWSELKISGDVQLVDGAPLATTITGVLLDEGLISELNAARMERGEQPYLFINSRGQGGQTLQDIEEAGICFEDVAFRLQQPAYEALRGVYARMVRERYGDEIGELFKSAMLEACAEAGGATRKLSDAMCLEIVKNSIEIFEDQHRERYARLSTGEFLKAGASQIEDLVRQALFKAGNRFPNDSQVKNSIRLQTTKSCVTARRIAMVDGVYYVDVNDGSNAAYAIEPGRWWKEKNPPVKFLRSQTSGSLPLIDESTKPDLTSLFDLVNVRPDDKILIIAWLLEAMRPQTPYPGISVTGNAGTGKTSACRFLRDILDPRTDTKLQRFPEGIDDFNVIVASHHISGFDNLSAISNAAQDMLCQVATGASHSKRKLYSDSDETKVVVHNPIIWNGIVDLVSRPDLVSRTLSIRLEKPATYIDSEALDTRFDKLKGAILAGIFNIFAATLLELETIGNSEIRLSDFDRLGKAASRVLYGDEAVFSDRFAGINEGSTSTVLDSNEAATAAIAYFERNGHVNEIRGSSGVVMGILFTGKSPYKKAQFFKNDIVRVASELKEIGIFVEYIPKRKKVNELTLTRVGTIHDDTSAIAGELNKLLVKIARLSQSEQKRVFGSVHDVSSEFLALQEKVKTQRDIVAAEEKLRRAQAAIADAKTSAGVI